MNPSHLPEGSGATKRASTGVTAKPFKLGRKWAAERRYLSVWINFEDRPCVAYCVAEIGLSNKRTQDLVALAMPTSRNISNADRSSTKRSVPYYYYYDYYNYLEYSIYCHHILCIPQIRLWITQDRETNRNTF